MHLPSVFHVLLKCLRHLLLRMISHNTMHYIHLSLIQHIHRHVRLVLLTLQLQPWSGQRLPPVYIVYHSAVLPVLQNKVFSHQNLFQYCQIHFLHMYNCRIVLFPCQDTVLLDQKIEMRFS